MTVAADQPKKLSLGFKIVWGLAALGQSFISGTYGALLNIFYVDYLGLASKWIGIAALIYAIWNAFNDPLFGYITDASRFKKGRRIPYLRYTAPFLGLTFVLVWLAPRSIGEVWLFVWMLVSMLLYDTAYTIIGLVYSALLPELSDSDTERGGLQVSSSLFALLGTLIGFIVPDFFRVKEGASPATFPLQIAMIIMAVAGVILILATTFKVKERLEFSRVDKPLKLWPAIKLTLVNKSFLVLVAANFMSILMSSMVIGMLFYVADYVLRMNTMIVLACVFIPLIAGVPLSAWVGRKIGVVQAQQVFLIVGGVGLVLSAVLPSTFILPCLVLAGLGLAGPQTLTNILFAQVADEDEIKSGVRREGAFFGVNALLTKPAQSVALALTPFLLEKGHFITRESVESFMGGLPWLNQTGEAIFAIKALFGLIPGIAIILGALLLFLFPLKGEYLKEIKTKMAVMHAQKHAQLEAMSK